MRAYIEAIGYFMVLSAYAEMLVHEKFRREIAFLTGLMLMLVVIRPLEGFFASAQTDIPQYSVPSYNEDWDDMRESVLKDGIMQQLEQTLCEQTGASNAEITLDEELNVLSVVLHGCDNADAADIAAGLCGIEKTNVEIKE